MSVGVYGIGMLSVWMRIVMGGQQPRMVRMAVNIHYLGGSMGVSPHPDAGDGPAAVAVLFMAMGFDLG